MPHPPAEHRVRVLLSMEQADDLLDRLSTWGDANAQRLKDAIQDAIDVAIELGDEPPPGEPE